jgi:DNA-binding CsgD family transcriptional regulator
MTSLCLPLMPPDADADVPEPIRPLTPMQTRIVDLIGAAFTIPEIARQLGASEHTVRAHVRMIALVLTGAGPALARIRAFARRRRAA